MKPLIAVAWVLFLLTAYLPRASRVGKPYFPTQKLEKMTARTSSTVVAPLMVSSACNAS